MRSFKSHLKESTSFLTDKDEIIEWLVQHDVKANRIIVNADSTVDVQGDVLMAAFDLHELPVKFNRVDGNFDISHNELETLEGCPIYVGNDLTISGLPIKNLEHCSQYIGGHLLLNYAHIETFVGVCDIIQEIRGRIHLAGSDRWLKSGGLGLLMIPKLQKIVSGNFAPLDIIASYVGKDDIFGCQQELIDKGYEAYAQL